MAEDVKTLREAAESFENSSALFSKVDPRAFGILCRVVADMIEREERELTFTHEQINERDTVIADEAWDAAIEAGAGAIKKLLDKFPDGVNPGTYADGQIESLYSAIDALNALRRQPRT